MSKASSQINCEIIQTQANPPSFKLPTELRPSAVNLEFKVLGNIVIIHHFWLTFALLVNKEQGTF